jgi:hypothetical protein
MAVTIGFSFDIEPYGKMNKNFFLGTTNMYEPKLYMNGLLQSWRYLGGLEIQDG